MGAEGEAHRAADAPNVLRVQLRCGAPDQGAPDRGVVEEDHRTYGESHHQASFLRRCAGAQEGAQRCDLAGGGRYPRLRLYDAAVGVAHHGATVFVRPNDREAADPDQARMQEESAPKVEV